MGFHSPALSLHLEGSQQLQLWVCSFRILYQTRTTFKKPKKTAAEAPLSQTSWLREEGTQSWAAFGSERSDRAAATPHAEAPPPASHTHPVTSQARVCGGAASPVAVARRIFSREVSPMLQQRKCVADTQGPLRVPALEPGITVPQAASSTH